MCRPPGLRGPHQSSSPTNPPGRPRHLGAPESSFPKSSGRAMGSGVLGRPRLWKMLWAVLGTSQRGRRAEARAGASRRGAQVPGPESGTWEPAQPQGVPCPPDLPRCWRRGPRTAAQDGGLRLCLFSIHLGTKYPDFSPNPHLAVCGDVLCCGCSFPGFSAADLAQPPTGHIPGPWVGEPAGEWGGRGPLWCFSPSTVRDGLDKGQVWFEGDRH